MLVFRKDLFGASGFLNMRNWKEGKVYVSHAKVYLPIKDRCFLALLFV